MVVKTALYTNHCLKVCCLTLSILITLCFPGYLSHADGNNETRNGSSVLLNDQAADDISDDSKMGCIDWEGKPVADGEKYVPNKIDMCMQCTCDRRFPIICHSVACSPPCKNAKVVLGACCEYECPDDNGSNSTNPGRNPKGDYESESDATFSLRMVASTVVSLLLTALVLFIVHKFRQRRVLLALRRMQARSGDGCNNDEMDNDHYIPDNFLSLECPPYTDPPPPYSPPKPPHILPGEQPPPYEEISRGEGGRRETRTGAGQEDRNIQNHHVSENTSISTHPVTTQNPIEENGSDFSPRYSSQNPVFGVEMEMPRHPTQTQDSSQNQNILPAYASTDIVFRNATFSTMITPPHGQIDSHDTPSHCPNLQGNESSGTSSGPALTNPGMPTLTAFQRFSSLFKRDRSKWKSRAQPQRPVSECNPPHYATLSRSHNSNSRDPSSVHSSDTTYRNGRRRRPNSYHQNLSFTDRMRLSYDSARAAYELAAVSPSTSSNSSNSIEQLQENTVTSSCFPTSTTYCTDVVSQSVSRQSRESQQRQMQASHSLELHSQRSPVTCSSTLSPSSSNLTEEHAYQPQDDLQTAQIHPHYYVLKDRLVKDACGNEKRNLSTFSSDNSMPQQPYFNHLGLSRIRDEDNGTHGACAHKVENQNSGLLFNQSPVLPCKTSEYRMSGMADSCANSGQNGIIPPSPQPAVGQMRRSHSAISQISTFSVCSETGEKKLKDKKESDGKPLAADCQYPQHHSLSQSRHSPYTSKSVNPLSNRHPPKLKTFQMSSDSYRTMPATGELSTFGYELQPATLMVPITNHSSHTNDISDSSKKGFRQPNLSVDTQAGRDESLHAHIPSAVQNAPVSPPFVTVQSGKLMPSHPALEWAVGSPAKHPLAEQCQDGNDESKKVRKKRERDKRSSLSMKHKDGSSPSHSAKAEVRTKHDGVKKQTRSCTKGLSCHRTDKKRVQNFPLPRSSADNFKPDYEDVSVPYGNADVYRSQGSESSFTSSYPPPSLPFNKYVENPNKNHMGSSTKAVHEFPTPTRCLQQQNNVKEPSPQSRKKPSHRRQTAGNRNCHDPSPVQQRFRSKSLTEKQHIMRQEGDIVSADMSFEQSASGGKCVKSGFGHDLAFDDQLGIIDMGINSSSQKTSGRLSGVNINPYLVSNSHRADGHISHNIDPAQVSDSKHESHVVPLPNRRRSGLSQDLSFINRSEINPTKRLNKRSSLPAFLALTNPSQKNYGDSGMNRNSHGETQTVSKHIKNSREERDQQDIAEENSKLATSYV